MVERIWPEIVFINKAILIWLQPLEIA